MEEKNWFRLTRKSVSTSRNKVIFQILDFRQQKKNVQIKEYCLKYTEIWFPLAGMENLFKKMFLQDEKTAYIGRNI